MKKLLAITLLLVLSTSTVSARPSFRSIRESAEGEKHDKDDPTSAGWRKQYFWPDGWGLRVTYPSSWDPPKFEKSGYSEDGTVAYDYARLIPFDAEFGRRSNYVLELYAMRWDVGQQMTPMEVETFIQNNTRHRFQSYWFEEEYETEVAGHPARTRVFTAMSGWREETWFSVGRYLYVLGLRSLEDYLAENHFFYEDLLASAVITPIEEVEHVPVVQEEPIEQDQPEPIDPDAIFSDVPEDHPYAPAIQWAKDTELIGGYPDGTFGPDKTINRAELMKILEPEHARVIHAENLAWKSNCTNVFPDVPDAAWFNYAVCFGKFFGLIAGYPDGTFKPERTVNVAEALKMIYKAIYITPFTADGPWYAPYFNHATQNNIFHTALDPSAEMTRKDVVWIVWKLRN